MDIIGALLWLVGLTVLPVREIVSRLSEQMHQATDEYVLRLNAGVKSFLVRRFLVLSLVLAAVEIVWAFALYKFGGFHARMWIYFLALTIGNISFALWNEFYGRVQRQKPDPDLDPSVPPTPDQVGGRVEPVWGFMKKRARRWLIQNAEKSMFDYTRRSKPLVWFVLVPALFILQAVDLQVHALYVPGMVSFLGESYGYTFHQRQWLEILSLVSWCAGGSFLIATGYFVKYTIRKGTRLIEWASTKTTQLAMAIPPGIEYSDTLKELGGHIDLIDEDFVSSLLDFIITAPIVPLLPLCLAVIFAPLYPIWFMGVMAVITTVIATFLYYRNGEEAQAEIKADSRNAKRIVFKLSVVGSVGVVVASFIAMIWWEDLLNAVYGVTFYAYRPWWIYMLGAMGMAAAVPFLWKMHRVIKASIKEGAWVNSIKEFGHSAFIGLSAAAFVLGIFFLVCMVQDIRGWAQDVRSINALRLDHEEVPGAVGFKSLETGLDGGFIERRDDQVIVLVRTDKPARGIVEFSQPQAARGAGLPAYLVLGPEAVDRKICGKDGAGTCDLYIHTVAFRPGAYKGEYRVVMRNADEADSRLYGKVEILDFNQEPVMVPKGHEKAPVMGKDALAESQVPKVPVQRGRVASAKPCPTLEPIPGFK